MCGCVRVFVRECLCILVWVGYVNHIIQMLNIAETAHVRSLG